MRVHVHARVRACVRENHKQFGCQRVLHLCKQVNATCVGFQATVSVCAKNDKEAQAMVDVSVERKGKSQSERGEEKNGEVWVRKAACKHTYAR